MKKFANKKKEPRMALGIKNSWKYEKDLIIILNANKPFKTIIRLDGLMG